MNCNWTKTTRREKVTGRPVWVCKNPGCRHVAYTLDARRVRSECKSPHFDLGEGVARVIQTFRSKPPCCRCKKRKHWLSRLWTRPLPSVVYTILVWLKIRKRHPSRVEELLSKGVIY